MRLKKLESQAVSFSADSKSEQATYISGTRLQADWQSCQADLFDARVNRL